MKPPRLPHPMLCLVFIQTERGVIVQRVIGDVLRQPFPKTHRGFWVSWQPLRESDLRFFKPSTHAAGGGQR